jgi:hypothetical protein
MWQAAAGLELLARPDIVWGSDVLLESYARQVVWAGVVIAYCRPFTKSRHYESLDDSFVPDDAELRETHDLILSIRDHYIAHTDSPEKSGCHVEQWPGSVAVGIGHTAYEEAPPERMADLVEWQKSRFKEAFLETRDELHRRGL